MRSSVKTRLFKCLDELDALEYDSMIVDNVHSIFNDFYKNVMRHLSYDDKLDIVDYLVNEYGYDSPEILALISISDIVVDNKIFDPIKNAILNPHRNTIKGGSTPHYSFTPNEKLIAPLRGFISEILFELDPNSTFLLFQSLPDDVVAEYRTEIILWSDYYSVILDEYEGDYPFPNGTDEDLSNLADEVTYDYSDVRRSNINYDKLEYYIEDNIKPIKADNNTELLKGISYEAILDMIAFRNSTKKDFRKYLKYKNFTNIAIIVFINELYELLFGYYDITIGHLSNNMQKEDFLDIISMIHDMLNETKKSTR